MSEHPSPTSPSAAIAPAVELAERLERVLEGKVTNLARMSGGASRETWSFDLSSLGDSSDTGKGAVQALILRRDPPTAVRIGGMPLEAQLFAVAAAAGVPVPRLLASGDADPGILGTGFLVMERVEGETLARRILRDDPYAHARTVLVGQMGAALAKLHLVKPSTVPVLERIDTVQKYRDLLDEFGHYSPAFEMAFRWLDEHRPPSCGEVILHGDFRLGNVIVDETGLVAVLDWELARLGDPAEDLAWLCVRAWRFGGAGSVAGLSTYQTLLDAYAAAGGVVISVQTLKWWEALGTLTWGVMCLTQANAHISGAIRSVELAAIGRRVAEQEHDLLDIMGIAASTSALIATEPSALAGVPNLSGLVEAVREFLQNDVMATTSGRVQFHARVAANVLAMIEREISFGPEMLRAHTEGLTSLGIATEAELATAIRTGSIDYKSPAVAQLVRNTVATRLAIANPKYA